MSQLKADYAEYSSLKAEIMGAQGLTVVPQDGCRPQKEDLGANSLPGSVMLALKHIPWCCWPVI